MYHERMPSWNWRKITAWSAALALFYLLAWWLARAGWWLATAVERSETASSSSPSASGLFMPFGGFFLPFLYLAPCALARRWLRPDCHRLVLTMGATTFCAMWTEMAVDSLFVAVLGRPA